MIWHGMALRREETRSNQASALPSLPYKQPGPDNTETFFVARSSLFCGDWFWAGSPCLPRESDTVTGGTTEKSSLERKWRGGNTKKTNLGRNKKRLEGKGKRLVRLGRFNNGGRTMRLN